MSLEKVGVVGAGQMGAGIAHVAALAGRSVTLADVTDDLAKKGLKTLLLEKEDQAGGYVVSFKRQGAVFVVTLPTWTEPA